MTEQEIENEIIEKKLTAPELKKIFDLSKAIGGKQ